MGQSLCFFVVFVDARSLQSERHDTVWRVGRLPSLFADVCVLVCLMMPLSSSTSVCVAVLLSPADAARAASLHDITPFFPT